jgi:hypothetical protein
MRAGATVDQRVAAGAGLVPPEELAEADVDSFFDEPFGLDEPSDLEEPSDVDEDSPLLAEPLPSFAEAEEPDSALAAARLSLR